ncbi:unnamed protein product, partial [Iphiclides podalirius]
MLNALDFLLLSLTLPIVLMASVIGNYERHVPVWLIKLYRYGSFGYKGPGGRFMQSIELPKSYYRHYYVFSSVLSGLALVYMSLVYFVGVEVNLQFKAALQTLLDQRQPAVTVTSALVGMGLIHLHCVRRCYESHLLQVFSSSGRINLCHHGVAFIHYATLVLAAIGETPLFCGDQSRGEIQWWGGHTKAVLPCVVLFLLASYEQYASNVILANLRKDKKSGAVFTEEHKIPHGRMFEMVSSPHRLCEIILYAAFAALIPTRTMFIMWVWVFSNQIQSALHAHEWYKKTFDNYPQNRMAIIPYLL